MITFFEKKTESNRIEIVKKLCTKNIFNIWYLTSQVSNLFQRNMFQFCHWCVACAANLKFDLVGNSWCDNYFLQLKCKFENVMHKLWMFEEELCHGMFSCCFTCRQYRSIKVCIFKWLPSPGILLLFLYHLSLSIFIYYNTIFYIFFKLFYRILNWRIKFNKHFYLWVFYSTTKSNDIELHISVLFVSINNIHLFIVWCV